MHIHFLSLLIENSMITRLSAAPSLTTAHAHTCTPPRRGSCSGKSSLANYLCEKFPHSITIHQDDFYRVSACGATVTGGATPRCISCHISNPIYNHILNIK